MTQSPSLSEALKQTSRAMSDFSCHLAHGSPSYATWRRRADASLEHSRARRTRPPRTTILDHAARLLIVLLIIAFFTALLWVIA